MRVLGVRFHLKEPSFLIPLDLVVEHAFSKRSLYVRVVFAFPLRNPRFLEASADVKEKHGMAGRSHNESQNHAFF